MSAVFMDAELTSSIVHDEYFLMFRWIFLTERDEILCLSLLEFSWSAPFGIISDISEFGATIVY